MTTTHTLTAEDIDNAIKEGMKDRPPPISEDNFKTPVIEAKAPVDPLDNPEINETAKTFMDSLPAVKALAKNMSAGGLGRVFSAVMEFPLGDKYPKFRSKAENELFIMSLSLLLAKNKMLSAVAGQHQQTQQMANNAINDAAQAVSQDSLKEETHEQN